MYLGAVVALLGRPAASQSIPADTAAQLRAQADSLFRRPTPENARTALQLYSRAAAQSRNAGRLGDEAAAFVGIARAYGVLSRSNRQLLDSTFIYSQRALPALRASGDQQNTARALNAIANVLGSRNEADSARSYYHEALVAFRSLGDQAGQAAAFYNIARSYDSTIPDSALHFFRAALIAFRAVGDRRGVADAAGSIGLIYRDFGHADSALTHLRLALELHRGAGNRLGEAAALSAIGATHELYSGPDSALHYQRSALAVFRAVSDRRGEASTIMGMGVVYARRSDADSAFSHYAAALSMYRALGERVGEGQTLINLANLYIDVARADSALGRLIEARNTFRATGDIRFEAAALTAIGGFYNAFGPSDSALHYARQAVPAFKRVRDRLGESASISTLAESHRRLARNDSALYYHRVSLALNRDMQNTRGEAAALANVGTVLHVLGQCDSALVYLHRGLATARSVNDPRRERHVLSTLGDLYLYTPQRTLRAPGRATAYFDSAAALHAGIARRSASDANTISFAETAGSVFARWALAWLARAAEVGAVTSAKAAMGAAERGRAQALLELLRRSDRDRSGVVGSPNAAAGPGVDLVAEVDGALRPLRARRAAALSFLISRDTLISWLALPSGEVRVNRTSLPSDSLRRLIRAARDAMTRTESESVQASAFGRASAQRMLDALEDGSASVAPVIPGRGVGVVAASATAPQALGRLAAILLPPALHETIPAGRELIVVPHGMLALIPFAALPGSPSGEPLGVRYGLRYAPSLASLAAAEASPSPLVGRWRESPRFAAVVVGNPATAGVILPTGDRRTFAALPGAEREAEWVATRLRTTVHRATHATESLVRGRLPNAAVVHLATHGFAFSSDARARASFVALAPDSAADGFLTVGEVLDDPTLQLRAELVVLSACQTGLGFLQQAEGVVGLQRAFLARGARSVLVSLWSVDDRATELLMRRFYTHWLDDTDRPSKAEALRRAQSDVRRTRGFDHARYWAGFQLVGAG